ncbi:DUF934 domain-containing protein [Marinobacterium stanieri]|uniref:Uncharacterized conserved protein, DUF934 family n=1 Tax=Marinobacterium stanieri TaxID=49186 RepID=A0A1N6N4S6_9GAMM|nr:DUF934 domain-containing protein [Marinobacterium stanieri]SIP87074.1 Uncharacterized conserved protein, DUF934 family [Marinobacterium stanieri]
MPLLINRTPVENDPWITLEDEQAIPAEGAVILQLAQWLENRDALTGREIGVLVNGEDDLEQVLALNGQVELIAVEFPAFTDGRGFSIARLLRRAGYQGQLRAVGDVTRDRLAYLERCGFDALDVPEERFKDEVLNAFDEVSVRYQGGASVTRPAYPQS